MRHPGAVKHPPGGRDRAGEHQQRVVPADRRGDHAGPRAQAETFGPFLAHQQQRGGTVRDLRGVAGGHLPVQVREALAHLLGTEDGLQAGQPLGRGVRADGLVAADQYPVRPQHGHDLRVESALAAHPGRARMGLRAVGIQLVPGQPELVGDQFRGHALRHEVPVTGAHARPERIGAHPRRTHRHPAHRFHARRDDDVVGPGHDALHGEVHRLLPGSALALDGHRGHVLGKARGQPGHPARCRRLLARLPDAAHQHVVHAARIKLAARHERRQHLGEQVDRVHAGQRSARPAPAHGRPNRVYYHRLAHMTPYHYHVYDSPPRAAEGRPREQLPTDGGRCAARA